MTLGRTRDIAATLIVALAVLVFFTTHQGWGVYLIGGSHRWAAGAITILGAAAFLLAIESMGTAVVPFATLGMAEAALASLAVLTGSLTPLSLLVAAIVVVWLAATARHAIGMTGRPIPH
jgi:hypothetical protein